MSKKITPRSVYRWIIATTAIVLIILSLYGTIQYSYCGHVKEGESLALIAAFIGIANALFLYATLQSQNNAIAIQSTERFETTFFNLLHSYRQVADDICVYRPRLNANDVSRTDDVMYKGRNFFSFALAEIHRIYDSICQKEIRYYNCETAKKRKAELVDRLCYCPNDYNEEVEIKKIHIEEEEALLNSFYHIKEEDLKEPLDAMGHSFVVFDRKMKGYYEQYERSLVSLLTYIKDSGQDEEKYVNIVKSQIGLDEFHFIQYLLKPNEKLLHLIGEMGLYIGQDERTEGHGLKRGK